MEEGRERGDEGSGSKRIRPETPGAKAGRVGSAAEEVNGGVGSHPAVRAEVVEGGSDAMLVAAQGATVAGSELC